MNIIERLEYEDYEEFACDIADKYNSLEDEFDAVSIIAKYNEAKEIIKELLCLGYDIASIDIHREEFEEYWDEYRIALNQDGIWCEKFKRDIGYFNDDTPICFVMDNCSSAVFKYIDSEEIYEAAVGEDNNDEDFDSKEVKHNYMVNGKSVDKETFNKYVSKFAPNLVSHENDDVSETLEIIKDIEHRMTHIDDMFREMDCLRRLFNW